MERAKILLVEDSDAWALRADTLLSEKYDLHIAVDSAQALKLLDTVAFNLVLLDIMLLNSELQGDDLVVIIKEKQPKAKIVMISALAKISIVEKCFDNGAKWYIHKTCTEEEIIKRIDSALIDRKYLYEYYCSLNEGTPLHASMFTGEGHIAGKKVCNLIENKVPIFPDEVISYMFFTPHDYYEKENIYTVEWSVPDMVLSQQYPFNGVKDTVLLFSEGENLSDVKNALDYLNIPSKVIYEGPQLETALFDGSIASVVLCLPPRKALFYLRKIKLIDPRIEVLIYHKAPSDFQDAIMLKSNGAYRLIDNILDTKEAIISMNERAMNNFKDNIRYYALAMSKLYWCNGFIGALSHHILNKGIAHEFKDLDLLRHISQVLFCEGFGQE
ncbi:MAG TPA: hypothetical protein DF296_00085 [Candidatus Margulisbacteria bacterium]|nr:MAG: hypothetical protein A2X43_11675 [Candidatus Margulisbacteria bacterium GWD2_39_127]OGI01799.1 MAG: hypothetical protein A2X42_04200 [Candidatus Margulisbacteria bacterium GWF2_38_17]OGI10121.1 MAG: hypothetical protein A2X41_00920 [Candidatus Margulisbacteria bacterium GWE2_39_32]HAR63785.1 hypothetical protein [Candidatus Margulisiibacteriota bacterium]HCT83580.1 hypothetical protein [Candidatus Margulisiibacteriota bacterium]